MRDRNIKEEFPRIRRLLMAEWDPIGVADVQEAEDEYDSYIPRIHALLVSGASATFLFDYLWDVETQQMGLSGDRESTRRAAERLIECFNK